MLLTRSEGFGHDAAGGQPSSRNVTAQIEAAMPLAQHSIPNPHWHKVG
ncbi:hypothetical protein HCH44_06905 [Sphingomonas melonis]|nr:MULTISPECIES: hypothetical protein [Sphingomonas]MBX8844636.1 hypothetical protein [Sphingomonas melonis]MBX8853760.1 hypothetical protein [Sphingomonas melonis]MBX8898714.1 hypothetical protein [Sphingomonas melonis]